MNPVRPTFERPPLVEQAITVMFEPIENFSLGDFGLFWDRIRTEFPVCEAQDLVEGAIESEDSFKPKGTGFRILESGSLPRAFYWSENRSELVQVQIDRFSFNWQAAAGVAYPRSEATTERFQQLFDEFRRYVRERQLGQITLTQCEIVNVNIMPVAEFGTNFADAATVFRLGTPGTELDILPVESYILNTQHRIQEGTAQVGRLYAVISPVVRMSDGQQAYRFELTARGAPKGNEGVDSFFEIARTAINAGFLGWTTEWAHNHWGKTNG